MQKDEGNNCNKMRPTYPRDHYFKQTFIAATTKQYVEKIAHFERVIYYIGRAIIHACWQRERGNKTKMPKIQLLQLIRSTYGG